MYQQNKSKKSSVRLDKLIFSKIPKVSKLLACHVLKSAIINENQIVGILTLLVQQWANWILQFLSSLPITMQQDVKTRGIICCGGSMLLNGLPSYLQNTIGCPIFVTDDPINTVSAGLMILLSRMED